MLHQVTEPTPWRGEATLFRTPEEDAAVGARVPLDLTDAGCERNLTLHHDVDLAGKWSIKR